MAGKIIPGSPGSVDMPRQGIPTFNPLKPAGSFGTKGTTPTGSQLSGLDTALGDHADQQHPLKPRRIV